MQERERRVDELARRYSVMMVVPSRGQAILPKAEERRREGGSPGGCGGHVAGRKHNRGVTGQGDKKEQLVDEERSRGGVGGRAWG